MRGAPRRSSTPFRTAPGHASPSNRASRASPRGEGSSAPGAGLRSGSRCDAPGRLAADRSAGPSPAAIPVRGSGITPEPRLASRAPSESEDLAPLAVCIRRPPVTARAELGGGAVETAERGSVVRCPVVRTGPLPPPGPPKGDAGPGRPNSRRPNSPRPDPPRRPGRNGRAVPGGGPRSRTRDRRSREPPPRRRGGLGWRRSVRRGLLSCGYDGRRSVDPAGPLPVTIDRRDREALHRGDRSDRRRTSGNRHPERLRPGSPAPASPDSGSLFPRPPVPRHHCRHTEDSPRPPCSTDGSPVFPPILPPVSSPDSYGTAAADSAHPSSRSNDARRPSLSKQIPRSPGPGSSTARPDRLTASAPCPENPARCAGRRATAPHRHRDRVPPGDGNGAPRRSFRLCLLSGSSSRSSRRPTSRRSKPSTAYPTTIATSSPKR